MPWPKACPVCLLTSLHPHPTMPMLDIGAVIGWGASAQVVVGNHYENGQPGIFIPPGALIPENILKDMWLWNEELKKGRLAGKRGNRCKSRDYDGIMSEGLFYGAYYFHEDKRIESPAWCEHWKPGDDASVKLGITFAEK